TDAIDEGEPDYRFDESFFVIVDADDDENTGRSFTRIAGSIPKPFEKAERERLLASLPEGATSPMPPKWNEIASNKTPVLVNVDDTEVPGLFGDYKGSTLTAHAFDRVYPELGKYLITIAVWLFAISTIISWSYYGEQGMVFLTGWLSEGASKVAILVYKLAYCGIIVLTCLEIDGYLETDAQIDMWLSLGLGVMLVVNIPLMWLFGMTAMRAYHDYIKRFTSGPMHDEIGREDESTDPGPTPVP
ncbi:MAG: alanine:cation symporter family protein, partial [Planctomycetota bacterium]